MREDLSHDGIAICSFIWILSQSDVNVVVGATQQVALDTLAVPPGEGIFVVNIRMSRLEDVTDEHDRLAFAEFCAVTKRNDVCQRSATWRRLALGNGQLAITGIAQVTERLQSYGCDPFHGRAEIILHRILLVIGVALMTACIAAEKIYSLWFASEGFELERKRFAARLELQLPGINRCG